ncbi:MAG: hypothetical protein V1779_15300 [bacterium]
MDLAAHIEDKLNYYAEAIIKGHEKIDEHALGEMTFYMALRRILNGTYTYEDVGLMDAINDTLQELKLINSDVTFYKLKS